MSDELFKLCFPSCFQIGIKTILDFFHQSVNVLNQNIITCDKDSFLLLSRGNGVLGLNLLGNLSLHRTWSTLVFISNTTHIWFTSSRATSSTHIILASWLTGRSTLLLNNLTFVWLSMSCWWSLCLLFTLWGLLFKNSLLFFFFLFLNFFLLLLLILLISRCTIFDWTNHLLGRSLSDYFIRVDNFIDYFVVWTRRLEILIVHVTVFGRVYSDIISPALIFLQRLSYIFSVSNNACFFHWFA